MIYVAFVGCLGYCLSGRQENRHYHPSSQSPINQYSKYFKKTNILYKKYRLANFWLSMAEFSL